MSSQNCNNKVALNWLSPQSEVFCFTLINYFLPHHSPNKFRHGFAVIALKNANDIQALKAVSQTLMHSNLSITDGVYGILSQIDVGEQMSKIGQKISSGEKTN